MKKLDEYFSNIRLNNKIKNNFNRLRERFLTVFYVKEKYTLRTSNDAYLNVDIKYGGKTVNFNINHAYVKKCVGVEN